MLRYLVNFLKFQNSRGISFTSEDEEMASQQFYSHKNIDPLLSSLVNYVQPTVFQSFEHAEGMLNSMERSLIGTELGEGEEPSKEYNNC